MQLWMGEAPTLVLCASDWIHAEQRTDAVHFTPFSPFVEDLVKKDKHDALLQGWWDGAVIFSPQRSLRTHPDTVP